MSPSGADLKQLTEDWLMQVTDKQVEAALKQLPFDYPTTLQPYVVRRMIEAAMQAAPELHPKRDPLSECQIDKLWLNFCIDLSIDTYTDFVRLIEKAHGIGTE
jgi:hypothetical protein